MEDLDDVAEIDVLLGGEGFDAVEDPDLWAFVRGQHLGRGKGAIGPLENDVREGAADVGADAQPADRFRAGHQRSSTFGKSDGGLMSTVAERCWASMPPSTLMTSPVM